MTLEKLHYYDLKEIVKGYCVSGLGKNLIDKLELKELEKYHNPKLLNSRNEVIGEMKSNFSLKFV